MQIVIVSVGSFGDLLPFLSIARGLVGRGHTVTIGTNREYEPHVRRRGFGFNAVFASEAGDLTNLDPRFWDPAHSWTLVWERIFAPAMRATYELIAATLQRGRCLVIASWTAFGARLAQERLGVTTWTAYLAPEALLACDITGAPGGQGRPCGDDVVFGPLLNSYRRELGLPPVDAICSHWMHSPQCGLALFPEWFCPRQPYWPQQVVSTGFPLFDGALMPVHFQQLEAFLAAGPPPIVFTPGTGMQQAGPFFRESLAACASLGARAILLSPYRAHVPEHLPAWALHLDYVPLNLLLPRAAALVYHGGIGTCAQAIRAGVPQLITPMAFDQHDNAQRVTALGLGLCLPMREYSRRLASGKLTQLLNTADTRRACADHAAMFARDTPVESLCDLVERLH